MLEVLPALRTEFGTDAVPVHQEDLLAARDVPDLRDRNACNTGGDTLATRRR